MYSRIGKKGEITPLRYRPDDFGPVDREEIFPILASPKEPVFKEIDNAFPLDRRNG